MQFRLWFENIEQTLPIGSLVMTRSELQMAVENIARGYPAQTEGPVEVAYDRRSKRYHLTNGYHRMIEFIIRGKTNVLVKVTGEANWKLPPKSDRFVFNPGLPYGGLENFIEPYLLKRL